MKIRSLCALLPMAAALLHPGGAAAERMSSAHFSDVSGVYGFGSAYMYSANFEQNGGFQELAISSQESAGLLHRGGKLAFYPVPVPVGDLDLVIVSSSAIRLNWTSPSSDAARALAGPPQRYILRYSSAGHISTDAAFSAASTYSQVWTPSGTGEQELRLVDGFNAGTTYYFALEALNDHSLRSELSNPSAAFALVPLAPMNFQMSRTGNSVTMTWIPPAGFNNRIPFNDRFSPAYPYEVRKYVIYRATAPAAADWTFLAETSSDTLSWTDVIGGGDSYYYHARAVNQAGASPPSYARSSDGGGLFFLAPDNQSMLEIPAGRTGEFFSASSDPMDVYTLEISTHVEDLGSRVVKSVEFAAYRGGLQTDGAFKLSSPGTLKLYYAKAGDVIVPSDADARTLSMYHHNGTRWLQMYGQVDEKERSVKLDTTLMGRYQLRLTERAGSFSPDRSGLLNRLITPNGDGKNDTMVFIFDNPGVKTVKGRIYDMRGALAGEMKPGPVSNSLVWDARYGGQTVPGGVYVYQLEADGTVYNGTVAVVR